MSGQPIKSLRRHHDRDSVGLVESHHAGKGFKNVFSRSTGSGDHSKRAQSFVRSTLFSSWHNDDHQRCTGNVEKTSSYMFSLDNLVHEFLGILSYSLRKGDDEIVSELPSKPLSPSNSRTLHRPWSNTAFIGSGPSAPLHRCDEGETKPNSLYGEPPVRH